MSGGGARSGSSGRGGPARAGSELAALAWRNVWRNRRRTALNVIALTMGMAVLVLSLGWIGGYHTYIYDTLRDFQTGEVQVMHRDWYAERSRLPVDLLVKEYETVRAEVAALDVVRGGGQGAASGVAPDGAARGAVGQGDRQAAGGAIPERAARAGRPAAVTGRVLFSVRVSTGRLSWRSAATAIDLRFEPEVGVLQKFIVAGRVPGASGAVGADEGVGTAAPGDGAAERGIWIGRPTAEKAEIAVGDTLFLRAVNRHGVENLYDAPVAGIFEYGYPALDEQMIYLDLATATELLDLDGAVTHVVVRLTDPDRIEAGMREVSRVVGAASASGESGGSRGASGDAAAGTDEDGGGETGSDSNLVVRPWQDFARTAVSAVEQDVASFGIMMAVVYLLIVLGILNSMSMSVHERTREIGTMRAIGMRGRSLLAMFALESVWQAAVAIVLALAISTPAALWLARTGVDIASSMPDNVPIPFGERFRADFAGWHYLFTAGSGLVTAVVGALIPARRAARISVVEAMRSVG